MSRTGTHPGTHCWFCNHVLIITMSSAIDSALHIYDLNAVQCHTCLEPQCTWNTYVFCEQSCADVRGRVYQYHHQYFIHDQGQSGLETMWYSIVYLFILTTVKVFLVQSNPFTKSCWKSWSVSVNPSQDSSLSSITTLRPCYDRSSADLVDILQCLSSMKLASRLFYGLPGLVL